MLRLRFACFALLLCSAMAMEGKPSTTILVDSATHAPLGRAAVFDRQGHQIGTSSARGRLPRIAPEDYPITVRYLGYDEMSIPCPTDTIFLPELPMELPEVVVETRDHLVLHLLGYAREYSTLNTYTDTVFLFREKMVDFMIPVSEHMKFRGWRTPRVLKAKSYYRFTNACGLDSVSDASNFHFSWSDWVGVPPGSAVPAGLRGDRDGTFAINGKYSPAETWTKTNDKVMVDIDLLADHSAHRWVPGVEGFFRQGLNFDTFKLRLNCANMGLDSIAPLDLSGYSYTVESRGRGREMFMFNRVDQPFFTSTYAEVYIIDKEYITAKEARQWEKLDLSIDGLEIYEPHEAPALQASVLEIVDRVEGIDRDRVRLTATVENLPEWRMGVNKNNRLGTRFLNMLKGLTGISQRKAKKNFDKNWERLKQR